MCREWPMCSERLSTQCLAKPTIVLSHVPDVIAVRVHNNIAIGLLEPEKYIHHLDLSLHDQTGLREDVCCWMGRLDNCTGVLRDVNWCQKVVRRIVCVGQDV